jgi:NAD(P)-dependent dehydrogenase (short-subunit alcohol dehydrogenase family)
MLMSLVEAAQHGAAYPELAGKRVMITGLSASCGVDIVRAFAEHRTRLVLQFDETNEHTDAIAEIASPYALDIKAFGPVERDREAVAGLARGAMRAFGGLDLVVNLVPLAPAIVGKAASVDDIERRVADRLLVPCLLGRIAANRMALSHIEGLFLNIAMLTPPIKGPVQAFACVAKAALAAVTRGQAQEWEDKAIRFNAIAPQVLQARGEPGLAGEPEIATLALYLASGRGRQLSGHVFEAE